MRYARDEFVVVQPSFSQISQDVCANADNASVNHTESACSSCAEIENAAAIEWAAIVYRYDNAAAGSQVGDAKARSKGQSLVGRRQPGAAAGIEGGHAKKCARSGMSRLGMNGAPTPLRLSRERLHDGA
jgi:hypothetical protein